MNVDTAYLQPIVDEAVKSRAGIASMAVYSNSSFITASGAPNQAGKLLRDGQGVLFGKDVNTARDAVLRGEKHRFTEYSEVLQKDLEIIIYPFTIAETGVSWPLMMGAERALILEEVNAMIRYTVIIAVIVLSAAAAILFFVSGSITKPIVNAARTLKDISEGEGDLTKSAAIDSKDEIGDLARYFNAALEKIKNLIITIKSQSAPLFDIGNELAGCMTETAAAVNQITANIQSIKGRVINQSAGVTETNAAMGQITVNIDKLSGHVDRQSAGVSQSLSAVEEMLEGSKQIIQEGRNLELATQEISNGMNEMAGGADQINTAAAQVNTISGANRENINVLVQEVSKFKVE
jgi:methyl-accepting chemotaxis protein